MPQLQSLHSPVMAKPLQSQNHSSQPQSFLLQPLQSLNVASKSNPLQGQGQSQTSKIQLLNSPSPLFTSPQTPSLQEKTQSPSNTVSPKVGRPVNENSQRQKSFRKKEEKKAAIAKSKAKSSDYLALKNTKEFQNVLGSPSIEGFGLMTKILGDFLGEKKTTEAIMESYSPIKSNFFPINFLFFHK